METLRTIELIDSALQRHRLDGPVRLKRAVTPREFGVDRPEDLHTQINEARLERAYYSTSVDWDWPGRPIYLDVEVAPGVGMFATYLAKLSAFPNQHEVLLERGLSYWLTGIAQDASGIWRGQVSVQKTLDT